MMSRTREMHRLKILATTVGAALLVCGLLFAYASSPAWAATITVNSLADDADGTDGECTLREAITAANTNTASGDPATGECAAGDGNDIIQFALPETAPWTVNLTAALPDLSTNIEIDGPGADQLTVTRPETAAFFRIFTVTGDTTVVTISGITITNGATQLGGGIANGTVGSDGGDLTVTDSTISGNFANFGGGISNNGGTLTVIRSTISDNSVGGDGHSGGGGIFSDTDLSGKKTTITNSTISGNTASAAPGSGGPFLSGGGGVHNLEGLTVIEHSTITLNTAASGDGSGVKSSGDESTSTSVLSTIISANQGTDVDSGTTNSFVSRGYNLIGDGNATGDDDPNTDDTPFDQTGDQTKVADPKLGALAENGGPTQTHALLTDSPAIDKGNSVGQTTDQRGEPRPHDFAAIDNATGGDGSDIGAFEVQPASNEAPSVSVARGGVCGTSDLQGTINLALLDPDTPAQELTLSANSSNQAVVPNGNITFGGGTDASRTLTVTAIKGGASTVTVTVSDRELEGSVPLRVRVGTNSNDTLSGSANAEMILARRGNDTASGYGAADLLCGRSGNDTLSGGGQADTLRGGNNDDTLTGGPRADIFGGGAGTDTATDFNAGEGDTQSGIP